ncbi:hypothetical protein CYMTET_26083 [Cymbomonas tetramitiformis]|uniref:Uncharacterized protein n=1 Tax=Cymbomonas tetramitiformis TaxID=36881 RepID=A0AAE0FSI3_9CHLO|nr:hypothetical protein CYMTET_26083 [Cymbomonas tetramitiformis]
MTWPAPKKTHDSVKVLSVNNFDALAIDENSENSENSEQSDHPPLHSDEHSEDFSQPEASTQARHRFISAEKKLKHQVKKQQRKSLSRQDDMSWYVPVRPRRPCIGSTAEHTTTFNVEPWKRRCLLEHPRRSPGAAKHGHRRLPATTIPHEAGRLRGFTPYSLKTFGNSEHPLRQPYQPKP